MSLGMVLACRRVKKSRKHKLLPQMTKLLQSAITWD